MKTILSHLQKIIPIIQRPAILLSAGLLCLITLLGIGIAWSDQQTNWIARRLGALLVATNHLRPQTGSLWQQIEAQTRTQSSIDTNETLSLTEVQKGLPDPIRRNRFETQIVPDTSTPNYVAIWKTPLPNIDLNDRPLGDIINSRRIYNRGQAVVDALELPDVYFHAQVNKRIEELYTQLGDLNIPTTDTLISAEGDTLDALDPDVLKTAVFEELAVELIPPLKQKEKKALQNSYRQGQILQIFLHRDLGLYRGELFRDSDPSTPIPFTISTDAVARIFNLAISDSSGL